MTRPWSLVVAVGCVALAARARAEEIPEAGGQRIDSRYCTIWLDPLISAKQVNRQISTWSIRPQVRPGGEAQTPERQLAAKCDTIFRRAQELLDMYPPGIHVTIQVAQHHRQIKNVHAARYGHGTEAIAFYMFENNTIYATAGELSESVLAHEMAHCIIDHYFGVRPPRKIEEMLAMYVDAHLGED
jgi:hypothetical protein